MLVVLLRMVQHVVVVPPSVLVLHTKTMLLLYWKVSVIKVYRGSSAKTGFININKIIFIFHDVDIANKTQSLPPFG